MEARYSGKELIDKVNQWNPGTRATSTFLNDCAADHDFLWDPPAQGRGKRKRYTSINLFEFGMQCTFKAMSLPRKDAKRITGKIRQGTSYHKTLDEAKLLASLEQYVLLLDSKGTFKSTRELKDLPELLGGDAHDMADGKGAFRSRHKSYILVFFPEAIAKGLIP